MSNFEAIPFGNTHKKRAKTPSFSSILLDAIYRSIDADGDGGGASCHHHDYPATATAAPPINKYMTSNYKVDCNSYLAGSKQRKSRTRSDSTFETLDLRHAIMIESCMERQEQQSQPYDHGTNNVDVQNIRIVRQKSVPTKSTVSDTSITRNFSKIRTNLASHAADSCFAPPMKSESSSRIFTKTKSRAMKIYGDLKKPKSPQNQPISPGAKIAAFINSIFRNSGDRKPNAPAPASTSTPTTSTCSSASSFSRSCLSKTTSSSRAKSSSSARSVRFYPVSVIVDEDSRPCGHRYLHKEEEALKSKFENQSKGRREKEIDTLMKMIKRNCRDKVPSSSFDNGGDDSDEEMNDGESCASSDLFELENLSSIGVSRYTEELPVYGTTSLHKIKG